MLTVNHLAKSYDGEKKSLTDVSFSIRPGEVTVIIGPSGAGKTTILRSINQLIRDDDGEILFDDTNMRDLNRAQLRRARCRIGMIFQNYNLIEPLTAIENVLHGCLGTKSNLTGIFSIYSNQEKEEALKLLQKVGLEDFAYQQCRNLSGGQKQRVGIARALMQHPKIILCDEPIASLDPRSTITVMDILRDLAINDGISVLINLHQVDIARNYADHVIGINNGQVVFDDRIAALSDTAIARIYQKDANLEGSAIHEF
ncbi:phosphonate ABC transporter ATP-binding protein [Lactobacillus sp. LC28-10]|uniref:Phosphonate ABC transporter ATP-binding protein n=1 Tax=Secundilactobacillus angelensis TaxID=2722706 RepID=A0ABX1KTT0_9LACO|nr:phosphonate ABC transporter ATP-binding protein [Secundilactobacillus angelensis]MCH5461839.1 phosphonate ABC transporter ATP-binding protein [Secundilactobacillus angelensis]NLR17327.1 phosphonate ABC transporter ATP-binding protein [Secundilactobacillus angelensis]